MSRYVTIKLTKKQAHHVWMNADGWMDAWACEGGLEPDEARALQSLCDQIIPQISGDNKNNSPFESLLRERIVESIEAAGFSWHSSDEKKIIDAIMKVVE